MGNIVASVNEYYPSKRCPVGLGFIYQAEIRRLCPTCEHFFHKDVIAAYNLVNVVRSHLEEQTRPLKSAVH